MQYALYALIVGIVFAVAAWGAWSWPVKPARHILAEDYDQLNRKPVAMYRKGDWYRQPNPVAYLIACEKCGSYGEHHNETQRRCDGCGIFKGRLDDALVTRVAKL
jgi:hypothetical protein